MHRTRADHDRHNTLRFLAIAATARLAASMDPSNNEDLMIDKRDARTLREHATGLLTALAPAIGSDAEELADIFQTATIAGAFAANVAGWEAQEKIATFLANCPT